MTNCENGRVEASLLHKITNYHARRYRPLPRLHPWPEEPFRVSFAQMFTAFPELEKELARQVREASLDHEAFETLLSTCDLSRCGGMCCHDGVFLGEEEAKVICELVDGEPFERRGGKLKTQTFPASASQLGEGYPSHFPKTRCTFLDENHYCLLQKKALSAEKHPWFWKPFPCWLHPMTFTRDTVTRRPILTLPTVEKDPQSSEGYPGFASQTPCGQKRSGGIPAWKALSAELQFLGQISGRNLLRELGGD